MARPRYVHHRKFNRLRHSRCFVRETATNSSGSAFADSNPTDTVTEPV